MTAPQAHSESISYGPIVAHGADELTQDSTTTHPDTHNHSTWSLPNQGLRHWWEGTRGQRREQDCSREEFGLRVDYWRYALVLGLLFYSSSAHWPYSPL